MSPKKAKRKSTERKIVHSKPSVKIYGEEKPITVSLAKKLLGWKEETDKEKFDKEFLLRDKFGVKIRCENNVTNRPPYKAVYETLKQEILNRRWRFNGESIIIGETGLILNGQHTLISLILASQEWEEDKDKWSDLWPEEPTIEKLVVYGVSEDDKVVNTMDTCKPRSLADVIYRSTFFSDLNNRDRKVVSGITDYAIRLLWHRTGESLNAFAPRKTHSESLDFLDRHPKLLKCIKHIFEESENKHIQNCISPGYSAGLLYLMATSDTDPSEYRETRKGSSLDFNQYDKACDFWVLIASKAEETSAIKKVIGKMQDDEWCSIVNRISVIIKAWNLYVQDKPITPEAIRLSYAKDEDGCKKANELPLIDGIDIGDPKEIDERHVDATDPTPQEIEERKTAEIDKRDKTNTKKSTKEKSTTKKKTAKSGKLRVGSVRWVCSSGREPWRGRVVELNLSVARMTILQGFPGVGNTLLVQRVDLREKQPKPQEVE